MVFLNSNNYFFRFFFLFNLFVLSTSLLDTKNTLRKNSQIQPSKKIQLNSTNKMGIKSVIRKIFQPFLRFFTCFKNASSVEPTWTEKDEQDHGFGGKWYSKKIVFDLNEFFFSQKVPPCYMNTSYDQYNFFGGIADTLVIIGILSIACFPKLAESYVLKCKALEKVQQEIEQTKQNAEIKKGLDNIKDQAIDTFLAVAKHQSNEAKAAKDKAAQAKQENEKLKEEVARLKEELSAKADNNKLKTQDDEDKTY